MEYNNFYEAMIENDLNPFVLFDNNGKMKDFNREAEFLFNSVNPKELYELAVSHASLGFGFSRKFISLKYGKSVYYAILVGYINDDEIGLRLYKEVSHKDESQRTENIELTNIYSLIELSKSTTLLLNDVSIEETYDVSIPEIKMNINQFLLTLNDCFAVFKNADKLKLKVCIKIGEYEVIQNKKHQVVSIEFIGEDNLVVPQQLIKKATIAHLHLFIEKNVLRLEFPMIL